MFNLEPTLMLNDGFGPTGMVFLDFHATLPLSLHVAISRKISTTCIALTWMHFLFVAQKCNCSTEGVLLLMRYTVRALRFFTPPRDTLSVGGVCKGRV